MPKTPPHPPSFVQEKNRYCFDAGAYALQHSVKDAKLIFDLSPSTIKYWKKKVKSNLTLHNGQHGGHR